MPLQHFCCCSRQVRINCTHVFHLCCQFCCVFYCVITHASVSYRLSVAPALRRVHFTIVELLLQLLIKHSGCSLYTSYSIHALPSCKNIHIQSIYCNNKNIQHKFNHFADERPIYAIALVAGCCFVRVVCGWKIYVLKISEITYKQICLQITVCAHG